MRPKEERLVRSQHTDATAEAFLQLFVDGDVRGETALQQRRPELAHHSGYRAHLLLREFADRNHGHCYERSHLRIADLLIPTQVRSFRDAVLEDRIGEVRERLRADASLASAEFAAGRGIA